jgi:hypothetical protein
MRHKGWQDVQLLGYGDKCMRLLPLYLESAKVTFFQGKSDLFERTQKDLAVF